MLRKRIASIILILILAVTMLAAGDMSSSLRFSYENTRDNEHVMELWFKPVFGDDEEDDEKKERGIQKLHALDNGISMKIDKNGQFVFDGFEIEIFNLNSLTPFSKVRKLPSFGADLSLGMREHTFLIESDSYLGLTVGGGNLFWFTGVHNRLSTVPMEYTLNFRNMVGARFGSFEAVNTTDMVLYSTIHDYFHFRNHLALKLHLTDNLDFQYFHKMENVGSWRTPLMHSGGVSLIWNFNMF